jgi:hypothetical protein
VCAIGTVSLSGVTDQGFSIQNCAAIITHILRLIDDFGSHTMPVYKSLCVLNASVKYVDRYASMMSILIPEILTILCLFFGTMCPSMKPWRNVL